MSDAKLTDQQAESIRIVYKQLCVNQRAIDDWRARFLVILPLVAGGVIILANMLSQETKQVLGLFGFVITVGLYFYELLAHVKCEHLTKVGQQLEGQLAVSGQYTERSVGVAGFVNETYLARVIYPTVLAIYVYLASVGLGQMFGSIMAFITLAFFFFIPRMLKLN